MVRPKLKMQPRNVSLGVAKQLGLDRPGEERQARAGAHSALACVMSARHLQRGGAPRGGRVGREKRGEETARLAKAPKNTAPGSARELRVCPSEIKEKLQ